MFDWVFDLIRSFLFSIAQLGGFLADSLYDILKLIITLDVSELPELWAWYGLIIIFVGVFALIRTASMWVKAAYNEEYRDTKYKPFQAVIGVFLISVVLAIAPLGIRWVTSSSQYVIENVGTFLNNDSIGSMKPTTIVTTSIVNGLSEKGANAVEKKTEANATYTIQEISSKLNNKKNKKYEFLPEIWHILFVIAVLVVFGIGMVLLAIQFGKRLYSLIMKILIAPIPISSLVNSDSEAFVTWIKMIISDVLTNFIQYYLLYIVLLTATSNFITSFGFFMSSVLLISGLLFILEGVPQLAHLIGGDTSTGGIMQQLSTIRMATGGLGRSIGNAVSFASGAAVTAGAFGIYSAGRTVGGKSLIQSTTKSLFQNPMVNKNQNSSTDYFGESKSNDNDEHRVTRPNTIANKIGDYASKGGMAANLLSNASRHLYEKSAERIHNNALAQGLHGLGNVRRNSVSSPVNTSPYPSPNLDVNKANGMNKNQNLNKPKFKGPE